MSKELFDIYIKNLNTSIELIDVIIPAIIERDYKVYNREYFECIINKAIRQHDSTTLATFHSSIERNVACLWFHFPDFRSEYANITLINDHKNGDEYNIKYFTYDINDKKRLRAFVLAQELEYRKQYLQGYIAMLQNELKNVIKYKDKADALRKELIDLHYKIPHAIRYFFNVKTLEIEE